MFKMQTAIPFFICMPDSFETIWAFEQIFYMNIILQYALEMLVFFKRQITLNIRD